MNVKVTDQMNREIELPLFPSRIISLVPSQTELLYDLGLDSEVVGITKFCIHPKKWFESKPRVGGTKNVDFEKIKVLQPDLIIGNKEENTQSDIEELAKKYPVWMSDVNSIFDALNMIGQIGAITRKIVESQEIIKNISQVADKFVPINLSKKALYLIWSDPYIAVGNNTFIDDMLCKVGYENAMLQERYVELSLENIVEINPDIILLSSEPFPFQEKHIKPFAKRLPNTEIKLVDGEMFSWYGSRMEKAFGYFTELKIEE